jgi:NodT family efflux transporter outer membrane factor (OMF) lipoprotein
MRWTCSAAAAYRQQIAVTQEMIGDLREQVRLAELQVQAGTANYAAVLSLRGQLAGVEATLPPLQQKLDQAADLLASLCGRAPGQWQAPALELADLNLPAEIPVSLPSELVARRPDILAAEAQLHAASADIGVATAAMLPSLSLNASYGAGSTSASNLFQSRSAEWSLGADLAAPLFEGGTLWFHRRAAVEAYRQSLAGYQQVVLAAFAQVADNLHALQHDADALYAQQAQRDAVREAQRLIRVNYQAGVSSYTQVLLANVQRSQAELGYVQSKALRLQDTVALFAALGGGWSEAPQQSTGVALAGQ